MKNTSFVASVADLAPAQLYLDLLKRCLLNIIYQDPNVAPELPQAFEISTRENGFDWPRDAHTMVGIHRLNNLQWCAETIIKDRIPGDFVETGVWRGGASIFLRAVLAAHGDRERTVWVADSFEGLPKPNAELYPADSGDSHHEHSILAVSLETVQSHFDRYGLLDGQVRFLKGWFKNTLPTAPVEKVALLRLDGDMYESTMDGLNSLYHKVSPGGIVVVDDYHAVAACKQATDDFRSAHGIVEELKFIDWAGAYWRKALK